jgi:hypothetical protein
MRPPIHRPGHRYRKCKCGREWNTSLIAANPKRYVCPICAGKEKAASGVQDRKAAKKY